MLHLQDTLKWLALGGCALLLMGCPYSSNVPLSEPNVKVADNFIGTWELAGSSSGDVIEVRRTGPNTVDIVQTSGYDQSTTTYRAHLTEIKGELFLNVVEDSEYSSYYFYKIRKDGEFKVTLIPVTTYIRETFDNSADLRSFFERNMQNSYFFTTEEETYYKIK